MVIDGSSPRLSIPRQMKMASGNNGMRLNMAPSELGVRDLEVFHFKELIRLTPDVREERVTQVRGNIEDGTYTVIAERIAEKIIMGDLPEVFF